MTNDDIILPGETVPINYKKVPFFATEVNESILQIIPDSEKINKQNAQKAKLDLFTDIIGSKKMFQKQIDVLKLDQVNSQLKSRLQEGLKHTANFQKNQGTFVSQINETQVPGFVFRILSRLRTI